jgi:hypothetical protein
VWLLFKARERAPRGPGAGVGGVVREEALGGPEESALARPPEGWAHLADQLAASGHYREAVRSLYLALLSRLHREGAIAYAPTSSNWDYFRAFKGPREQLATFRELTHRFDFVWYGHSAVGPEGYQAFRSLAHPLLLPRAEEPARG